VPTLRAVIILVGLLALTGAATMSTATAQEKKEPRDPKKAESYDEKVAVRSWDGRKFAAPVKDVPAFRGTDRDGKPCIWTRAHGATHGNPTKGSELIDKDGVVWIVGAAFKNQWCTICEVHKKAP
jgi:hypothetical protein